MHRRNFAKALVASTNSLLLTPSQNAQAAVPPQDDRTTAEIAAAVTPTNYSYPPLNVMRYGARGDGVADDRLAIKAAIDVAKHSGGGVITFPRATYLVSSYDAASPLQVPAIQSDLSVANSPVAVQLYVQNASNIVFDFQGSTLHSNVTSGASLIVLDGCSNVRMLGPSFSGTTVMSTGVTSLGSITGGSGYTNGTYVNVPLTGGMGTGAHARIVCSDGAVTGVVVTFAGYGYAVNDVLSCSSANVGGNGSGVSVRVTSVTGEGNTPVQAGVNALMILSLTRPSSGIDIIDLTVSNCYTLIVVTGDPNSSWRATNISLLGNSRCLGPGEYGVCLHNNGDDVFVENAYVYKVNRPVFLYGVSNVTCNIVAESMNGGFSSLVKAYGRAVRNICLQHRVMNSPGVTTARIGFESQHNINNQAIPQTVQNVYLDDDEVNVGAGFGIEFDYWAGPRGATRTATASHPLFNNFVLRGSTNGTLQSNVSLQSAALCQINFDHLQFSPATSGDLNSQRGFVRSRKFVYTPILQFGEATVSAVVASADYYVAGGMCTVTGSITLRAKNGGGQAQILMPFGTRADSSHDILGIVLGESNMSGLGGPIVGCISPATNRLRLFGQAPSGLQPVLDTNFTASSVIRFQVSFPL